MQQSRALLGVFVTGLLLFVGFASLTQGGSPGTFAQIVLAGDTEAYALLEGSQTVTGNIGCINSDGDGTSCDQDADDPIYIDMDGGGVVTAGDIRLTVGKSGSTSVGSAGSVVKTTEADCCSQALTDLSSAVILFLDSTGVGDDIRQAAEQVYLATNGNGTTVTIGDLSLSVSSVGTRASAAGTATLYTLGTTPRPRYWDKDGDGVYSGGNDGVYFDMDANNRLTAGDIIAFSGTLAPTGSYGTVLTRSTAETVGVYFTAFSGPTFVFSDDGDSIFEPASSEGMWLSLTDTTLNAGDVRLVPLSGQTAGTTVDSNDAEITSPPSTMVNAGDQLEYYDVNGNNLYEKDENLYIDAGATANQVGVGDVRVNTAGGFSVGAVASGATDIGRTITSTGVAPTQFRSHDSDGSATYNVVRDDATVTDAVFFDNEDDGFITSGDIRITSNSGTQGAVIVHTDADVFSTCAEFDSPTTEGTLLFFSIDSDSNLDLDEPIYLSRNNDDDVDVGELRMAPASSALAAGTFVRSGDFDEGAAAGSLFTLSGTFRFNDDDGIAGYSATDLVYIDSDGGGQISVGDVRLIGPTGTTGVGSKVTSGSSDLTRALTAMPAIDYCFVDVDGDNAYGLSDYVYLDIRSAGVGPTAGDVRLSGTGGSTAVGGVTPTPTTSTTSATTTATTTTATTSTTTATSSTVTSATTNETGNATGNTTEPTTTTDDGGGSPGLGVVAIAAGVIGVVVVLGRRRRHE